MRNSILLSLILLVCFGISAGNWAGSWACAPQQAGNNDLPHGADLSNHAARQVVHLSLGGDSIRLRLSNLHSTFPLTIKSVYIANTTGGSAIDEKSVTYLSFNGEKGVKIPMEGTAVSDNIAFKTTPLQLLSITINYAEVPDLPTIHGGARTTSYIVEGEADASTDFSCGQQEVHWYSINGIDVYTKDTPKVVACLGNSITDGRGSTTDKQDRWTDVLAENFNGKVGVLNLGIGGNCVVYGGIGPNGKTRFNSDILAQTGVTHVIVFEGINDVGSRIASQETVDNLIKAYSAFIRKAHKKGLKIYCGTITPMGGTDYYSEEREGLRQQLNNWIKTAGEFDGVLDIDAVVANPVNPSELNPNYKYDNLHPNAEGYKVIGDYIAKELKSELK
jgi:lysophospholipase L1-like esterase